jgi:hypothetical protein
LVIASQIAWGLALMTILKTCGAAVLSVMMTYPSFLGGP